MAEHQIETRILLRYDTYSNWMNSNVILRQGEAAIAAIPTQNTLYNTGEIPENTPPAIGLKIGDGRHYFSELPWVQAVAADVYNWAKQQTKPIYTANDIQGLENYIKQFLSGDDTTVEARMYRIIQGTGDNANKYFLQSRGANDNDWQTDTVNYIDFTGFAKLVAWVGSDVDNFFSLGSRTQEHIEYVLSGLDYNDTPQTGQVVTAVSQTDGKISVSRQQLNLNELAGTLDVAHGGTGKTELPQNEVLVGNGTSGVKSISIDNLVENNDQLVYNYAVKAYVDAATAGLTGAMHYIGEATVDMTSPTSSTVDPQIPGYTFKNAESGDVITFNAKEFVWTGTNWRLLGDEGSYAVKGSITNVDISPEADIDISKIYNLSTLLDTKVDKIEGKTLTSNDFTTEYKQKLDDIEENAQRNLIEHIYINGTEAIPATIEGKANSLSIRLSSLTPEEEEKLRGIESRAQVNLIEHIFLNDTELPIKTVKNLSKSVQLELIEYTEEEQQKLAAIEAEAQKNIIETISVNGNNISPSEKNINIDIPNYENKIEAIKLNGTTLAIEDKAVNIQLSKSALDFTLLDGARVPNENGNSFESVDTVTQENARILSLARIAKTGSIYDITNLNNKYNITTPSAEQDQEEYIILNCGTAQKLIDNFSINN